MKGKSLWGIPVLFDQETLSPLCLLEHFVKLSVPNFGKCWVTGKGFLQSSNHIISSRTLKIHMSRSDISKVAE